jgi:hypothetical protein
MISSLINLFITLLSYMKSVYSNPGSPYVKFIGYLEVS